MPYDLDSLRSKVESRFESVDKLSKGKFSGENENYRIEILINQKCRIKKNRKIAK